MFDNRTSIRIADSINLTTLRLYNLQLLARLIGMAAGSVAPRIMGIGPVPAIQKLLAKTGLRLSDFDRIEINEAFAAQVLACTRALDCRMMRNMSIAMGARSHSRIRPARASRENDDDRGLRLAPGATIPRPGESLRRCRTRRGFSPGASLKTD